MGLSECEVFFSLLRMRYFSLSYPEAWAGNLSACGQSELSLPADPTCSLFSDNHSWWMEATRKFHHPSTQQVNMAALLNPGDSPAGSLELPEDICWWGGQGDWHRHIRGVECGSQPPWGHLGAHYISYPVASTSGAMRCHGDFLFPTSSQPTGLLLLLCFP